MRHRQSGRQLNRNSSHRQAMFKNMSVSLIEHELIKTTVPKAKELRRVVEPLITLAKADSVANRRLAFSRTRSKEAVGKLFDELGPRYQDRPGGYLRIIKAGFRTGDKAPMAYVELVDRPAVEEAVETVEEVEREEAPKKEEIFNIEMMIIDILEYNIIIDSNSSINKFIWVRHFLSRTIKETKSSILLHLRQAKILLLF